MDQGRANDRPLHNRIVRWFGIWLGIWTLESFPALEVSDGIQEAGTSWERLELTLEREAEIPDCRRASRSFLSPEEVDVRIDAQYISPETGGRRLHVAAGARPGIVCVCDTQPVTAVAIRTLLGGHGALSFSSAVDSLSDGFDFLRGNPTSVLLIDKAFGLSAICDSLIGLRERDVIAPAIVVWGAPVSPADAMRSLGRAASGWVWLPSIRAVSYLDQ
jgi:hypothetical protein